MGCQGCTIISYLDHSEADDPESAHEEAEAGYQWEHRRSDCFKTIFPFQILFKAMEKYPNSLYPRLSNSPVPTCCYFSFELSFSTFIWLATLFFLYKTYI